MTDNVQPPPSPTQVFTEAITCAFETAARLLHREPASDEDCRLPLYPDAPRPLFLTIRRGDAAGLVANALAKIREAEQVAVYPVDLARLTLATSALHTAVAAFRAADSSH